jgi:hypothetical protein
MPIRGVLSKLLVLSFADARRTGRDPRPTPLLRGLGSEYNFWVYILSSRNRPLPTTPSIPSLVGQRTACAAVHARYSGFTLVQTPRPAGTAHLGATAF